MTLVPPLPPRRPPRVPHAAPAEPCPQCGGDLAPVVLDPHSAPWLCARCRLGFFSCELTAEARAGWEPGPRCFGWRTHAVLVRLREQELAEAHRRGTSLRPDQLRRLSQLELKKVAKWAHLERRFAEQVKALLEPAEVG